MSDIEFDVNQYAERICEKLDEMVEMVRLRRFHHDGPVAEDISAKQATRMMIQSDIDRYLAAGGEIKHIPAGLCVSPEYSTWGMCVEDFK